MRETIENLYNGRIKPCEKEMKRGSEYDDICKKCFAIREQLIDGLNHNQLSLLNQLSQSEELANDLLFQEQFVCGFRLGAMLVIEAMGKNDGDFSDKSG